MDIDRLEINEIDEAPPPFDLTPGEIEALAEELVDYRAEFADLCYGLSRPTGGTSICRD